MEKKEPPEKWVNKLISKATSQEVEKKKRVYKREKTLPAPIGFEKKSPRSKKGSFRQAKVTAQTIPSAALEQMHCTQNQNYPLFFLEKVETLQMRKVQNIKVKERWIAARNLKYLSHQMQVWVHKKVKILGKDSQEFYDFMQRREERHFQIDRIIRYLSDS